MATYCIADLHGHLNLLKKVQKELKPGDRCYILGDCGDRGPEPWETIKYALSAPQFIYLKGNHEDMLVKATKDYLDDYFGSDHMYDLLSNGGGETFKGLISSSSPLGYIQLLEKLPLEAIHKTRDGKIIHLSHAGYTPGKEKDLLWGRAHLFDFWPSHLDYNDWYIVHGHTSTTNIRSFGKAEPYFYSQEHKIDIDVGTIKSKCVCLLNLDTFEYKIIK